MVWNGWESPHGECRPKKLALERWPSILEDDPDPLLEGMGITGGLARAMDDDLDGQEPR
jgi:hypothetical protein